MSVTPEQVRAARGWLGWNQDDLAKRAQVGLSTLRDFEAGKRLPIPNNLAAIRRSLEEAGIKFDFDANGKALGVGLSDTQGNGLKNHASAVNEGNGGNVRARTQRVRNGRGSRR